MCLFYEKDQILCILTQFTTNQVFQIESITSDYVVAMVIQRDSSNQSVFTVTS